MITPGQKFVIYSILLVMNIVFFVFIGLLAAIPLIFSAALVMQLQGL